jgi:hypothetical protein
MTTQIMSDFKPKDFEAKYYGPEPKLTDYGKEYDDALSWYSRFADYSLAKTWLIHYLGNDSRLSKFKKINENKIIKTKAWLARLSLRGLELSEQHKEDISAEIDRLIELKDTKPVKNSFNRDVKTTKETKEWECFTQFESETDLFWEGKPYVKMIDILKTHQPNPPKLQQIIDKINRWVAELSSNDPYILENFSHMTKKEKKRWVDFYKEALEDIHSYTNIKKAERAPRVKKKVPPEKVVAKIQYKRYFEELKMDSVNPVEILKATEVWVYNIKTRKLGAYYADPNTGFSVKGSSILGFTQKSVMKTIRKPNEQLKEFMKASKPASKKFFNDIVAVDIKMNGRFSNDLVILKVYK